MFTGILTISPKIFGIPTAEPWIKGRLKSLRLPLLTTIFSFCIFILIGSPVPRTRTNVGTLPIGQVQGRGNISDWLGQSVQVRGVATGVQEDENTRGARFYTVFIQDIPGSEDGDPQTSDGIPIFFGANRPAIDIGDVINVSGVVSEYYGLTEIDFRDLRWAIEKRSHPLPEPIELVPPVGNLMVASYYERYEGMLVKLPKSIVIGPTHIGCGFSVAIDDDPPHRVFKHQISDSRSKVIHIVNRTDVTCASFPSLNFGEEVEGIKGPLTYQFEQFKIVLQDPHAVSIKKKPIVINTQFESLESGQISLATFNMGNFFDSNNDTGDEAEPILDPVALSVKKEKLAYTIANSLSCPTLIGVQEVEHAELLKDLAIMVEGECNFHYEVAYREAPDIRGSDLALMSDPRHVVVANVAQVQGCTTLDTGVIDPNITCAGATQPLFSRPPLQVDTVVDDVLMTIVINHFKSKRGGEAETFEWRLAQAEHLQNVAQSLLSDVGRPMVAVVGDFNDYYRSPVMEYLTDGGYLLDALFLVPEEERYSYIFDGYSQLIDWILVSPELMPRVKSARVVHVNADFHFGLAEESGPLEIAYQSSDHDIPVVILEMAKVQEQPLVETPTKPVISEPDYRATPGLTNEGTLTATIQKQKVVTTATLPQATALLERGTAIDSSNQSLESWRPTSEIRIVIILGLLVLGAVVVAFVFLRRNV